MKNNIIGYGSFFADTNINNFNEISNTFLEEFKLFYAGRYAMKYVFKTLMDKKGVEHIWLPNYYCPFVKNWLESGFDNLKYYEINPFEASAQIDYSQFSQKDIVLVNNYWGLKKNNIPNGERPIIVEDHSHGWLSKGCVESEADLCIASLRKTIPVPLGGIAWKPKRSTLDFKLPEIQDAFDSTPMNQAWNLVLSAMEKKASCKTEEEKAVFLDSYVEGENLLRTSQEVIPLSSKHANIIQKALLKDYKGFKKHNLTEILPLLKTNNQYKILSEGYGIPFGLVLVFKEYHSLMGLKQHLISNSIYPAELWPQNNINQEYQFLLNIHIDYRYNNGDLKYIASILNSWSKKENEHV